MTMLVLLQAQVIFLDENVKVSLLLYWNRYIWKK